MSLQAEEDLDALEHSPNDIDDLLHTLVQLELSSVLGLDAKNRLTEMTERMGNTVLAVRDRGNVLPKAIEDEIGAMAGDGYVGDTVETFRRMSEGEDEDADVGDRALQLLYRFHRSESQ
jgi:hypothetical protein